MFCQIDLIFCQVESEANVGHGAMDGAVDHCGVEIASPGIRSVDNWCFLSESG